MPLLQWWFSLTATEVRHGWVITSNRKLWVSLLIHALVSVDILLVNSLAPGRFECNFEHVKFKLILVIDGWGIFCEVALIWMSLDFTDDKSTLVQVMAWCRQATSHYLSQCWPRSVAPNGITRPEWVNILLVKDAPGFFCLWSVMETPTLLRWAPIIKTPGMFP